MKKRKDYTQFDAQGRPIEDNLEELDDIEDEDEDEEDLDKQYEDYFDELENQEGFNREKEYLERYNKETELEPYSDTYSYEDIYSVQSYYQSLIRKVLLFSATIVLILVGTIIALELKDRKADNNEVTIEQKYTTTAKKLITELYEVSGIEEVVAVNPKLMSYFEPNASYLVDFTNEENYLRRFSEFNNEALTVDIHELLVKDSVVYINYTIKSDLNANSNRYAIIEFNDKNKIIRFEEYWHYIVN